MQWKGPLSGIPDHASDGVAPSTALVCDDLDEHGDDDGMQGPSQRGVARMLGDMAISPSLT